MNETDRRREGLEKAGILTGVTVTISPVINVLPTCASEI